MIDITELYFNQATLHFLSQPLLNGVAWLDYWLLVHFIAGAMLIYFIGKFNLKLAIVMLILFEVFEFGLMAYGLATPEPVINTILDVIVGGIGYLVASLFL
jgi:hypothetical protein